MLPLDLHVLGLPLAFILSQDQTLHCISLNVCPTPGNPESPHQNGSFLILRCRYNMYMNFLILLKTESNYITSIVPSVFALYLVGKAAANLQLFSKPASFFWKKNQNIFFASKTMSLQELTSKHLGVFRAANVKRFFGLHNAFFVFFSILSIRQNNTSICLWTYPKKTNLLLFSGCKCNTISTTNKSFFGLLPTISINSLKAKQIKIQLFLNLQKHLCLAFSSIQTNEAYPI